MALYSLRLVQAEMRSRRWVHARNRRVRHLDMGPAGMMLDTASRLSKVLGRRVDSQLEGVGVLLTPDQLRRFLLFAATPDQNLVAWASERTERYFIFAVEE